ncbi:glycine--tRNA ligase subunit beta [Parasphingopyxis marina]|uniref:Glycine--tRNA ligase beta subunit n=1 Tax=Parasphingopyxis marina TaxID=2761622 RepID=A0A842HWX2_9SPHN|nr:glycine--tRNA ligase subunit beta [Parasphingopyxis marina]MBC2777462.1 glycine--tRNA ligase subunit beta [Parasphingopyxis marina]
MTDFLLEILSEEIPARMQAKAREDLARLFTAELAEAGLNADDLTVYSTPRRLALIAKGLPAETQAVSEERRGPRADAPDKAIEGFLRGAGVTRDQLEEREDKKGTFLFAVIDTPGRATRDVLAEAIPAVIRAFPWPKSMRWGAASESTESLRWVRPLQGIVAIFGEELVECSIGDATSGYDTVGHRFHHTGPITIGGADDYVEKLRACHVIVDQAERETIVRDGAKKAAEDAGLVLVGDEGLVVENAGLTEWPVPLLGTFDESYLEVPEEVIQLTARINQKYFICRKADGSLAPNFVCTANIEAKDGGKGVVAGNEKVLAARLSDAKFFWEQDRLKTLEQHAERLGEIVFHEKLGTVADKVERVARLARWLAEEGIVAADPDKAEQAARLAKADLVTGMVGEFADLQGVMGGYYAEAEGLDTEVANAIRDHYKPVGQGDEVPRAPVTVAVSLADKLDTLSQFFAEDMKPTGSKDPFALRRAGLGVLELLSANEIRARLFGVVNHTVNLRKLHANIIADEVLQFLIDRLKVQQREAGVRHDLIDAVFALGGEDDLVRLLARVKALQAFVETEDGVNLLAGYKRAANILKKEEWEPLEGDYAAEPAEAALREALDAAEPKAAAAIEAEDFEGAMAALASLRAPIDSFFETVTVNDEDAVKRASRLQMLERMRDAVHTVADFSKIEGGG